jgi:hypothetical protein
VVIAESIAKAAKARPGVQRKSAANGAASWSTPMESRPWPGARRTRKVTPKTA